jgi:chromosomal replication initiator protein
VPSRDASPKQIWKTALGEMQLLMTDANFNTWLRDTQVVDYQEGTFTVGVASPYAREWLQQRFASTVQRTLEGLIGEPVVPKFVLQPGAGTERVTVKSIEVPREREHDGEMSRLATPAIPGMGKQAQRRVAGLNQRYTFDTFIVGAGNRLAHAASQAVANHPGETYNPLFIYGGVGLGKTHLMQAIGHHVAEQDPDTRIRYISSERFTNELITSIREQTTQEFRNRYREVDLLLIDDIQFIAGKEMTQEEFFHTFNALYQESKQIVISNDRPPKAILTLEDRLRSRFEMGLIVDIQPPEFETRKAILQAKALTLQTQTPDEVLDYIARQVQSNIRELEGALNRVLAYANLHNSALTPDLAALALDQVMVQRSRERATPEAVLQAVCSYYKVTLDGLSGKARDKGIVIPRQVAMYLMRTVTNTPLARIGEELGGRDHTTVLHGAEKVDHQIREDGALRRDVLAIRDSLQAGE